MRPNHILLIIIVALVTFSTTCHASWLIYHKQEYRGRVVDIDTGLPIEGAVVIAMYHKETLSPPVEPKSSIIHVKEVLTDKEGNYAFPSYTTLIQPFSWSGYVMLLIYKPGYLCFGRAVFLTQKLDHDIELYENWSKTINYKITTTGTIMIPKLSNLEDRSNSLGKFSLPTEYIEQLPISKNMQYDEINYLNSIRGK